jgi:quinol monooxygenase YgiN
MITRGLLVRMEARPGMDAEVEKFLRSALPLVQKEPATAAWFAIRFGRSEYGIFDVFPDDEGREAHLNGPVANALMAQADALFVKQPDIYRLSVLASKLPAVALAAPNTKALLLTFKAKTGRKREVEQFLIDAEPLARQEPTTTAWFAIHLDNGEFGIFDAFPDSGGRFAHLVGQLPRELAKHALTLLGSMPELEMLDVIADKVITQ